MAKFQRTKFRAYVKLGSRQKSKQKYRRAKGRHNKTRQQWKSRPRKVEIGFRTEKKTRDLVNGKQIVLVKNIKDLKKVGDNQIAMISKIGNKNKLGIIEEAEKMKIEILNLNVKKFKRKIERKREHKKKIGEERDKKKKAKEKKPKEKKQEEKPKEEKKK